jgi:hypothetical protein
MIEPVVIGILILAVLGGWPAASPSILVSHI